MYSNNKIKNLLFSGSYNEAQTLIDSISPAEQMSDEWRGLRIAICSQQGAFFEAEQLANHFLNVKLRPSKSGILAAFFLALGCIRISQYAKGRFWLSRALIWARALNSSQDNLDNDSFKESSEAWFYAYQGTAFLNFFCGNFIRSKYYAQKANLAAKNWEEPYGLVLSFEILAQSNYRLGHCNLALLEFQKAREIAARFQFTKLEAAIKISELILSAQTGRLKAQAVEELNKARDTLHVDDIYSKNELVLELAQQLILSGKTTEALQTLNLVSSSIYKVGHLRQAATLNLRLAFTMYLRGELDAARALLLSHFSRLNPKIDRQLRLSYLGLLVKINPENLKLVNTAPEREVTSRGLRISLREKSSIQLRMENSFTNHHLTCPQRYEDPLGDLFDDAAVFSEEVFLAICNSGYLSLLPRALNLRPGAHALIVDKLSGRGFIVTEGDVLPTSSNLKPQVFILLELLKQIDFVTKDQVTSLLWKSKYKPDRHEKSLQSAMTRLKTFLEPKSHWLESSKFGFRLAPFVDVRFVSFEKTMPKRPPVEITELSQGHSTTLNSRQLRFLTQASELFEEYFSSQEWSEVFQVSLMTATRDLNLLCEQGRCVVVGKGRATRYSLNAMSSSGVRR